MDFLDESLEPGSQKYKRMNALKTYHCKKAQLLGKKFKDNSKGNSKEKFKGERFKE